MKTPYHYFLGIALGIGIAFFLPANEKTAQIIESISEIVLSLGRYVLLPLIFFSLPVAVTLLRRLRCLGRLMYQVGISIIISSATLTILGTLVAWLANFKGIPVVPSPGPAVDVASFGSIVRSIVQFNGLDMIGNNGAFLLPLIVLAFIMGWHFHHDREIAEPSFNLFDSLSRIFYRINRYFLVLMPGFLAFLSAYAVLGARMVVDFSRFLPLLYLLSGISLVIILGIYPFLLWILGGRRSPWPILRGLFGTILGAFTSASPLFNYGNLTFQLKENLKTPRHSAALAAPIYLIFARGGTALVSAVCMITIVRSYSSLEITLFQTAWTALFSFLISFALPMVPDRGLITALVILGNLYNRGLNDGWLILAPIFPLLIMIASGLDTITGALMLYLANQKTIAKT